MKKWINLTLIMSVCIIMLTACGQETAENNSDGTTTSGDVKEFVIEATSFEFDVKEIKVKQGDTVKITLKNKKGYHGITVEGYNKQVRPNRSISFVANKKGEFEYKCSAYCGAGHNKMVGKLIVT
ncbi:cupredoxin domain-containing protein [Paenibacillus crassostreae]|uniref:EfeO-type cupredoxin-like domain-containing protein n=1 Tax=Paenibacillus crassostreae TaxID=1763538 RepID=A0A167DGE5_9BACL|nr:cupredoxin domain-containing protein [Paenibacillus crassostreae]AOZ91505.1 hypothetical protein LPB68_04285 [Paenibacillus crassostreae]OAB74336.1 hypothetical protein PNBC_09675 [Paenibacillus crassostreae]